MELLATILITIASYVGDPASTATPNPSEIILTHDGLLQDNEITG